MNRLKSRLYNNLMRSKSLNSLDVLDDVSDGLKVFQKGLFREDNCERIGGSYIVWEDSSAEDHDLIYENIHASDHDSLRKVNSVFTLERKIEKLNDLLLKQQKLLVEIKNQFNNSLYNHYVVTKETNIADNVPTGEYTLKQLIGSVFKEATPINSDDNDKDRARSLLDAIELKQAHRLEQEIKEALTKFLQSDDLKEQIVSATEQCVRDVIRSSFSQNFSAWYMPTLERSHRRLLRHVTNVIEDSFKKLEDNANIFSMSVPRRTKTLRQTLQEHQSLLEEADCSRNLLKHLKLSLHEILQKELKEWREHLFNVLFKQDFNGDGSTEDEGSTIASPKYIPVSPPQPSDPKRSIIEQLLNSAEINKLIKEGKVNTAFEKALSSSDLALVMAACRAADPANVFCQPCKLRQSVLLSLIQQLATDMVHDTQLKCRYLEDAIINLNTFDIITRNHLPVVVEEVRKHLTKFLTTYPSHLASRRVTLITMAANNLLK